MRRLRVALAALLVVPAVTGCVAGGAAPSERRLTVFAAASLSRTFTELGARFEASHAGVDVVFTFDGSSGLLDQLKGGARADVFASADVATMAAAQNGRLTAGQPVAFARNVLTLVVPPGNPAGVTGLDDSLAGTKLVVCAPQVPCGAATDALAERAGVMLRPVSQESKVTDVLGKVASGEADAGIVYVTDARGAGDTVRSIPIADADRVVNVYPISVLAGAPEPQLAAEFVALVTSTEGQDVLGAAGFRQT